MNTYIFYDTNSFVSKINDLIDIDKSPCTHILSEFVVRECLAHLQDLLIRTNKAIKKIEDNKIDKNIETIKNTFENGEFPDCNNPKKSS